MSENSLFTSQAETVSFGERLANSQAFADLFRDGMALVEETASASASMASQALISAPWGRKVQGWGRIEAASESGR